MSSSLFRGAGSRALRVASALAVVVALVPTEAGASERELASDRPAVNVFAPYEAVTESDFGEQVIRLQASLRYAGFYRGELSGEYDAATESAVVAFHKYLDVERTSTFNALDWIRIAQLPEADIPYRWDEPDRVEIDTTRQLIYVIREQEIVGILPTSTASGAAYFSPHQKRNVRSATPHGDFHLYWRQWGWNCDSVSHWCVYNYWGFAPFYGIHGYRNVPPYPASHGCSRVHIWDSDWLDDYLFIGMPVHIWRVRPEVPPPPPLPTLRSLPR